METIQLFKVFMNNKIEDYILPTLKSGMITQGKKVEEFENKLKEYFNYPYILTLNSATSGLTLAYRLLNIDETHKVISTPLTCFATNAAILANNLRIVWADTDPDTNNIDLDDVKKKLNYNTRVLSFVHWGGVPVDLNKVNEIKNYYQEKYDQELYVVEDCAHAFGAEFDGKKLGTHGNICVFSLQAIKHLTTGDGGLIFLPNEELYKKAKLLRWFGIDRERRSMPGSDFRLEPDISEYGYKFHMNDINASIGLSNIIHINNILEKCRNNGNYYNNNLKNIYGLELFNINKKSIPSYWIYTLKIKNNRKLDFINFMKEKNIVVSQVHARNDNHSCLSIFKSDLPKLNKIENEIISIPVGWWLTEDNLKYIVDCIKDFFKDQPILRKMRKEDIKNYKKLLYQMNNYIQDQENEKFDIDNIFVLEYNDKIISTGKLLIENKLYQPIGHIEDIVTDNEHRKNGFSKFLIEYLKHIAFNEYNCYKIVLNCKVDLENFYKNCGLEKTGISFSLYNS